jgi:rubrerythrin
MFCGQINLGLAAGQRYLTGCENARLAFPGNPISFGENRTIRGSKSLGRCRPIQEATMSDDVKLCVEILNKAIAFEEEGMRFFGERSQNASTRMERNVFRSLAKDEAGHKAYLIQLRDDLLRSNDIDSLQDDHHSHRAPRQIFEEALASVDDPQSAEPEELEILRGAMEVEKRGFAMYSEAAHKVDSAKARELFLDLAAQEQNHHQLLHNTYEYMANPEGWHGYDESPMLDGG